jgi:uncharacterized membrane protein YphA (DoxX/SURF4 family)
LFLFEPTLRYAEKLNRMRFSQSEKEQFLDFFVLAARFLLGFTFIRYGFAKLTEGQFGLTTQELQTPLQDLDIFRVSWYLFDFQPFKLVIGVSQLLCGILLILNRTALLGAFLFLPIVFTILVIDLTYMPLDLKIGFTWRLSWYILLDLVIFWHYRERMMEVWKAVWIGLGTKFKYSPLLYLGAAFLSLLLEFAPVLPRTLFGILGRIF